MNIVLFDESDLARSGENLVTVRDRRATHILDVLKLNEGATFRVGRLVNFDGQSISAGYPTGGVGQATVVKIETPRETQTSISKTHGKSRAVTFEFGSLDQPPPPASPVELILALPRPKSLKRCLRAVANLGIKSVHLIHSIRVDKSYWTAPALDPVIMREALIEGLSIARDPVLPRVQQHRLFKPFAQDIAPHLITTRAFVAHPPQRSVGNQKEIAAEDTNVRVHPFSSLSSRPSCIPVAIGPEGGFIDYEIGLLNEAGFENLSLGERIYSVECAVPVIETLIRTTFRSEPPLRPRTSSPG